MAKTIPMPGPGDFVKYTYEENGKCCLIGWARLADGRDPAPDENEAPGPMEAEVIRLATIELEIDGRPRRVFAESYNNRNDGETLSRLYEEAARNKGYVVENKPWRAKR